jgi:SAM-dependent methyltransferase
MEDRKLFSSGSVADGYREHLVPVIFAPWAQRLLDFVGVQPGQAVLDVASGTGVVARAAAGRSGATGSVIASDPSAEMLAHATVDPADDAAPITTLQCSATELAVADASVDVVVCQQGFPFIPDRVAAATEMRRVLRPGGAAGVAVWLSNPKVEPFMIYGEALRATGLPEPFPSAYDSTAISMSVDEVRHTLSSGGLKDVDVETQDLMLDWPSPEAAVIGVFGTPYGPIIAGLDEERRASVMADLKRRMTAADGTAVRHRTTAVLGRGVAPT